MNLSKLYDLRQNFIVIGLTGRVGAGCTTIADIFTSKTFDEAKFPEPKEEFTSVGNDNNNRKYKIAYNFLKENWEQFYKLKYSKVLSLIVFKQKLEDIEILLDKVSATFNQLNLSKEKECLLKLKNETNFTFNSKEDLSNLEHSENYNLFESQQLNDFHSKFDDALKSVNLINRIKILHTICNNQRYGGCYFCEGDPTMESIYSIADEINSIVKGYRQKNGKKCKVIIDSLRNPFEIMYFKERFSAYFTLAVNPEEEIKEEQLSEKYETEELFNEIKKIDILEYGEKNNKDEFYKQNIQKCIEKADLHLSFLNNSKTNKDVSYPFDIKQQIVLFYSLMLQPGIITPTPQERCMQIAYTAKYNSGCISRQVGAVIADEFYSVKSIGWNNTPEGHVPCVLRNSDDLLKGEDNFAFSKYEKDPKQDFQKEFKQHFENIDKTDLKGHNCSYCFKDIQNSITEGKNQVHTRSLHAEENAMLQVAKYGGQALKNGILFTTASPCELCSKKAFQLGVSKIYYVDPYPGIAISHILECGDGEVKATPKLFRFTGAIGRAYHKLYEPFMAYKDEIYIRTNTNIINKLKKLENENADLKRKLKEQKTE
jgi:deoxycytidylate deaminase